MNEDTEALQSALIKIKQLKLKLNRFDEPVAIIGMACRFPGSSNTPEAYWDMLQKGVDGVVDIPSSRFDIDAYYGADAVELNKISARKGSFIDNVDLFDADFFGISPIEAEMMDPQQRLLLHTTWEALERACIPPSSLRNSGTGVFIGVSNDEYGMLVLKNCDQSPINAYFGTGNALNALSGRLSYFLGAQGPSVSVDTACSSSLVSLHLACTSLQMEECSLAIAGGVNILLCPACYQVDSAGNMLSPDGYCKTFDAGANGFVRGEGVGVLILKRLSDALRDRDQIHAVIRGSAINQDGPSSGLTVPNGAAQEKLMRQCLSKAKLSPLDVSYIEAHGTGTSLGDPIEVHAITGVYCESRSQDDPLFLGSVKSNIGHLESAAGVSSVMKVVLALNQKEIPGNLHFTRLNPKIDLRSSPVKIIDKNTKWNVTGNKKRIAGISGFGVTGTNVHIALEEPPALEAEHISERSSHFLPLSAKTETALNKLIADYVEYLETTIERIGDICFSASSGRNHEECRIGVVAENLEELKRKLKNHEYDRGQVGSNARPTVKFEYSSENGYTIFDQKDAGIVIATGPNVNWKELVQKLSMYYTQGAEIDWKSYELPFARKKLTLPTYPFQYKRFWSPLATPTTSVVRAPLHTHPYLARRVLTPGMEDIVFESTINFNWPEFVKDHLIYDFPVLAGASYLSALVSAIAEVNETGGGIIHELSWLRPLVFVKGESRILQIVFKKLNANNEYKCDVFSRADGDIEWLNHVSGTVTLVPRYQYNRNYEPLEKIQSRLETHFPADVIYSSLKEKVSLDLGPQFRWMKDIYLSTDEILASLRGPENRLERDNFILHPGYVDSVLQTLFSINFKLGNHEQLSIPLTLHEMWFDKNGGYPSWVHVKVYKEGNAEHADFTLLNDQGYKVGELKGFVLRPVPKEALIRAYSDTESLEYETVWEEVYPNTQSDLGHWILCGDEKVAKTYAKQIEAQGGTVAYYPSIAESLMRERPIKGILQCVGNPAQFLDLVELVNKVPVPLFLLTEGITPYKISDLTNSPLNGVVKAAIVAHPSLKIRHIDLLEHADNNAFVRLLCSDLAESIVVLDGTNCFAPKLVPARAAREMRKKVNQSEVDTKSIDERIDKDSTYLIVGEASMPLVNWLLEHKAGEIIITAAHPPAQAHVRYEPVDMSIEKSAAEFFSKNNIKGIFCLTSSPVVASHLHTYSKNLDFFILLSSISTLVGLDSFNQALCAYRNRLNMPALNIVVGKLPEGKWLDLLSQHIWKDLSEVIFAKINWSHYLNQLGFIPSWLSRFASFMKTADNLLARLDALHQEEKGKSLEQFVRESVCSVLGFSENEKINPDKNFFDMGFDSIMAVTLVNKVQAALGNAYQISKTAVFDFPTIKSFSGYCAGLLHIEDVRSESKKTATVAAALTSPDWLVREAPLTNPKIRLFCFHHAGGSSSAFKQWQKQMPEGVELNLIELPGRGKRYNEPLLTDMRTVVHGITHAMLDYIDKPYIIFAHSMGTMVASEVLKTLQQMKLSMPQKVIFSCFAPIYFYAEKMGQNPEVKDLSDDELVDIFSKRFQGIPQEFLNDRKLLEPLLPILRADAMLMERDFVLDEPFTIDLTTINCRDDIGMSKEAVMLWSKATTGRHQNFELPGGHMAIVEDPVPFIEIVKKNFLHM